MLHRVVHYRMLSAPHIALGLMLGYMVIEQMERIWMLAIVAYLKY